MKENSDKIKTQLESGNFEEDISFLSINIIDLHHRDLLSIFHAGIYSNSFSNPDERETLQNLMHYLEVSRQTADWDFQVILAQNSENEIIGGVVFDYFADVNATVVEFLCVDGRKRREGIGSCLWEQIIMQSDKLASHHGKNRVSEIYCEVDSPEISPDARLVHLKFWKNKSFQRLDFDYIQPALSKDTQPVKGLWFLCLSRFKQNKNAVTAQQVERVLWNYIRYAMDIRYPDKNETFMTMKSQLHTVSSIPLVEFPTDVS